MASIPRSSPCQGECPNGFRLLFSQFPLFYATRQARAKSTRNLARFGGVCQVPYFHLNWNTRAMMGPYVLPHFERFRVLGPLQLFLRFPLPSRRLWFYPLFSSLSWTSPPPPLLHPPRRCHKQDLNRVIFLETVAGIPGMVAGTLRHLTSLRRMRRWVNPRKTANHSFRIPPGPPAPRKNTIRSMIGRSCFEDRAFWLCERCSIYLIHR